jgi:hypothetical protein
MVVAAAGQAAACPPGEEYDPTKWSAEWREHYALLREVFGTPVFRPVSINPDWLNWRDGTVSRLAQVIYEERRFADLPVLADALEEAGCDNTDVLDHCRGGGEHVRGSWVVDLLLGKE